MGELEVIDNDKIENFIFFSINFVMPCLIEILYGRIKIDW